MALASILRNVPKTLKGCARGYSLSQSMRISAVLSYPQFKPLHGLQEFSQSKSVTISAVPTNSWKLQKFDFSTSSKLQSQESGNHSKLWSAERLLSAGLLAIVPAAMIAPSQPLECIFAVSLVMHTHWGIEATVVDYVRPILFGPVIPKIAHGFVYVISVVTLVGLLYLIFDGCGIVNAIRLLWRL